MAKRGWIENRSNLRENAKDSISELISRAGFTKPAALYRKNDQNRANAKTDPTPSKPSAGRCLPKPTTKSLPADYRQDGGQVDLMKRVAQFSPATDGPRQAVAFLAEQGIAVEVVPHLPRTHLDGAAMKLAKGRPVIGLTLRYDRIDNFWWVLMHELAHVA